MNIIIANKQKNLIYSSNIEIVKELTGVFNIEEVYNKFRTTFYRKIIFDATALADFPKRNVLEQLSRSFDLDKLILLLPNDNPPPKEFLSYLVSIGIYNFTDNPSGLRELVERSNTYDDVKDFVVNKNIQFENNNTNLDFAVIPNNGGNIVLGVKNVTDSAGATTLIYMLKKQLENTGKMKVIAVETDKQDFIYFNDKNMDSIKGSKLEPFIRTSNSTNFILVDLSNNSYDGLCTDVIYLVEPSLFKINKLLMHKRSALSELKGKKVVLNKSLLNEKEAAIFAKEAGLSIYFNVPYLNDRILNPVLEQLLYKLGAIEDISSEQNNKKGLFNLFK